MVLKTVLYVVLLFEKRRFKPTTFDDKHCSLIIKCSEVFVISFVLCPTVHFGAPVRGVYGRLRVARSGRRSG